MPVDMKRYPPNWTEISYNIRFVRAGGRCECTGECDRTHHGRCTALHDHPHPITGSAVILTTAHLGIDKEDGTLGNKHDKMDVRPENLKAMCQACHLNFDRDEHIFNAATTRRNKRIAAGQLELLLILLVFLVGCSSPPQATGGLDPNAAAWSAAGTATAASISVNGTAVSVNATRQATIYMATTQAQATAVQATSAAAPTVTAQHELLSVVASGQATQDAIAADVARAEATATAVHLRRLAEQDAARAQRAADVAMFWYWFRWAFLAAFCFSMVVFIPIIGRVIYYRLIPISPVFYDDNGQPRIYHKNYHALPSITIEQPRPPATRPQPIFASHDNGATRAGTLPAPDTAERQNINRWLVAVLNGIDFNRTTAETYRVNHDRADMLIQLAIRQGYAAKGEGRTSAVEPLDHFGDFINQFIGVNHSPTPA